MLQCRQGVLGQSVGAVSAAPERASSFNPRDTDHHSNANQETVSLFTSDYLSAVYLRTRRRVIMVSDRHKILKSWAKELGIRGKVLNAGLHDI